MPAATVTFPLHVLVVDDEKNIRTTLGTCLEGLGCKVVLAASGAAALAALGRQPFELAFLDLRLGEEDGLALLPSLLAASPTLDVVIVTAYATVNTAVDAIKRGARDYLPKPFNPAQIRHLVERTAERRALTDEVADLRAQLGDLTLTPEADFDSSSAQMRNVLDVIARAASHEVPVLLRGENGTGKSLLARRLNLLGRRRSRPFVVVNCPTLSEELLASELFGHVRGAFTGAVRDQVGRVEAAAGGTLFLDEIGELTASLQAKLLRFLQDKQFERLGDNATREADVRVVAATNRDLDAEVKTGRFREDLLYRLNTVEVTMPPLRERKEDILPLARRMLAFFARTEALPTPELSKEAEAALVAYPWPGNVRELRNAMERAIILSPSKILTPAALPDRIVARAASGPFLGGDFTLEEIEREHIVRVLDRAPSLDDAARALGIDSSTLWRKRKRYEG